MKLTRDNKSPCEREVMLAPGQSLPRGSSLSRVHVRACSHEPGTVNYPGASVTSRSHDDLLSRVNFIAPGQAHHHLITTNLSEFI